MFWLLTLKKQLNYTETLICISLNDKSAYCVVCRSTKKLPWPYVLNLVWKKKFQCEKMKKKLVIKFTAIDSFLCSQYTFFVQNN